MDFSTDAAYAAALDDADPLRGFRERFAHHHHAANHHFARHRLAHHRLARETGELVYLDGNSLGRLPHAAADLIGDIVHEQWGAFLIRSWNEGWFDLPERLGAKLARLLGAAEREVIIADSTSVNLFKLAVAALHARPGRTRILTDDLNFPSDLYILQGVIDLLGNGHTLEIIPSPDGIHGPADALAALDERVALVCLSHTVFKNAYTYDMAALTAATHVAGALTLWDLSHSAGSVLVDLSAAHADLAVGCTYKYLNGGPGAPAFLYVRGDLQEELINPIAGWMGQRNLFDFGAVYQPAGGLRHFLSGTPPVLSMAAIEPGLDLLLEAGMEQIRAKSVAQTDYFITLWQEMLAPIGYRLNTPRDTAWRGSHVALGHDEAWRIAQALTYQMNVLPDFRRPDNIRLGFAPLYNSFVEVHAAATALRQIVADRLFERYPIEAPVVT